METGRIVFVQGARRMGKTLALNRARVELAEVRRWVCGMCDTMIESNEGDLCNACTQYSIDVASGLFDDPLYDETSYDFDWP